MPRNQLKRFPTAMLRRGMVHFHPASPAPGSSPGHPAADNPSILAAEHEPTTTARANGPGREKSTT